MLSDEMQEKVEEYMVLEKWIEVNKATIKEKEKQLYAFEAKIEILRSVINRTHMILQ